MSNPKKTAKAATFSILSAELDEVVEQLQTADIDIDEAVKLYERGMNLVKELQNYLKTTENKVTKLRKNFET